MYVITVSFFVKRECLNDFMQAMHLQAKTSLEKEPQCLQFDVSQNTEQPDHVFLYEVYRSPSDFDAHLSSAHFKSFAQQVSPWVEDKRVESFQLAAGLTQTLPE